MPLFRRVAFALSALAFAVGAAAQGAAPPRGPEARPPFPLIALPEPKSFGQRAIDLHQRLDSALS